MLELDSTVRLEDMDMSASPNLKKRKKRLIQPGKKTSIIRKTVSAKPGMVARIANYFESTEMKNNTAGSSHIMDMQHNNNVLSRPQTSQTEPVSVTINPEMAVLVGLGGAQPMGRGYLGHMTSEPRGQSSAPMGAGLTGTPTLTGTGGHIEGPIRSPGTAQGSAGDL